MTEPQRRGRKYGSDYARAWARELHFGDVRTKATLMATCNYVDEDGACWPSIGTLADDTDQSEDSVRRRLVVLENLGVIARFPRWRDDRGKINYDNNGRRTTDEIRLLFNVSQDDIDAKNPTKSGGDDEGEAAPISPSQQQGQNSSAPSSEQGSSPSQQQGGRSHCSDLQYEPSLEPDSPKRPPLPAAASVEVATIGSVPYERFTEAYGEGSVRPERARTLWDALSDEERELAIRGAKGYRSQRIAAKKSLIDPERFLRSRDLWSEFASKPAASAGDRRTVPETSEEGRAWRCLWKLAGLTSPPGSYLSAGEQMISLPGPISPQVLALADATDARGRPIEHWQTVDVGSNAFGAWRELLHKAIGRGLMVRDGKLTVPATFPPRADGSWPEFQASLEKTG